MTHFTELEAQFVLNGIQQLQNGQKSLHDRQDKLIELQAGTNDRMDHLDECVDGVKVAVGKLENLILSAIPGGDVKAHHDYHFVEARKESFWAKAKSGALTKVFEWAAVGFCMWFFATVIFGLKVALAT